MKKIMGFLLCLMALLLIVPNGMAVISQGYSHSNDYYTVSYDGEGDAIVRAKLMIDNDAVNAINELNLEFPGRNIIFYDVFEESKSGKTCLRYKTEPSCAQFDKYYNCEKYEDKTVCDSWDLSGASFVRITNLTEIPTAESTVLNIKLTNTIEKGDSGAITVVYKIPKLAKNFLGAFNFQFRTVLDQKAKIVNNVRVAVNVDNNLYLKGTSAEVDYRNDFFGSAQADMMKSSIASEASSYNKFSEQIVQSRGYVKTASNLDPMESFVVKGEYSKSFMRVHIIGTIIWIIVILGLIASILFGVKKLMKKVASANVSADKKKPAVGNAGNVLTVVVTSAVQAVILTGLWFLAWFIMNNLNRWINYNYMFSGMLGFLIVILFALLILAVFFAPPIFIGIKRGILPAIATFVLCIIWLIILIVLIIVLLSLFNVVHPQVYY